VKGYSGLKFYYFDMGITNKLLKRGRIEVRSESFGHAFEHFLKRDCRGVWGLGKVGIGKCSDKKSGLVPVRNMIRWM
jgi:hypothetical protein